MHRCIAIVESSSPSSKAWYSNGARRIKDDWVADELRELAFSSADQANAWFETHAWRELPDRKLEAGAISGMDEFVELDFTQQPVRITVFQLTDISKNQ